MHNITASDKLNIVYAAGVERRSSLRLIDYWCNLKGDAILPHEDDMEPGRDLLKDLWDYSFVVQLRDMQKKEFNYTYLGPELIKACETDLLPSATEKDDILVISLQASHLMPCYKEVIASKAPYWNGGEFKNHSQCLIKFRQVFLPFGHDNQVNVILGYTGYMQLCPVI